MNGQIDRMALFDMAIFSLVRVVKRAVYELEPDGQQYAMCRKDGLNWKYRGHLVKGLSSNRARAEIYEAYSK